MDQHGSISGPVGLGMIDRVHQQRQHKDVREQYKLMSYIAADLAHLLHELEGSLPLWDAQPRLASKSRAGARQAVPEGSAGRHLGSVS